MTLTFLDRPAIGLALLRVVTGIIFLVHGLQKLGGGIEGTAGFLGSLGVPAAGLMAVLLIATEVLGGLGLILGLFTRYLGLALAFNMLVAILLVHLANGFFASNGGYEFTLLLLAASLSLAFLGAGAYSLDALIAQRRGVTAGRVVGAGRSA